MICPAASHNIQVTTSSSKYLKSIVEFDVLPTNTAAVNKVNFKKSQDFLLVKGRDELTITLIDCRMRNYAADLPITVLNNNAIIQTFGCIDKAENIFEYQSNK